MHPSVGTGLMITYLLLNLRLCGFVRPSVRSRLWYFLSPLDGASVRELHCQQAASFFRGTHKVRDDLQLSHFVG